MIERLRELLQKATPGPWRVVGRDFCLKGFPQVEMNTPDGHYFPVNFAEDADLIVETRNSLPSLLDRLEQAEARVQELEKGASVRASLMAEYYVERMKLQARVQELEQESSTWQHFRAEQ